MLKKTLKNAEKINNISTQELKYLKSELIKELYIDSNTEEKELEIITDLYYTAIAIKKNREELLKIVEQIQIKEEENNDN